VDRFQSVYCHGYFFYTSLYPRVVPLAGPLHPDHKIVARAPLVVLFYRHNSLLGGDGLYVREVIRLVSV